MDPTTPANDEVERLSKEIPVLVDRLHNEYNKFFAGAEKRPPIQLREQLNKAADRLRALIRQVQSHQIAFRAQGAVSKVQTYTAMWDKKMVEREDSKKK
jgi:hypothetical protein